MPRIPESELADLKATISLERLVRASGVALKKKGADLVGRCPFHKDKTPSLVVTPATNLWHCLGACAAGGSVVDWVMRTERCNFREAIARLRADSSPSTSTPLAARAPQAPVGAARKGDEEKEGDAKRLQKVADFYHQALKGTDVGRAYLNKRGVGGAEVIAHFRLGYANRSLGREIPSTQVKAGRAQREQLRRIGVMRRNGREHLRGSVVVPLYNEKGEVVQLYGRKVTSNLRAGTAQHLYLAGPMRGVFNREGLKGQSEVILCESLIDALTFWCAGLRNVTACYGVAGFTDEVRALLTARWVKRITIAFDRDEAGEAGALKIANELIADGKSVRIAKLPRGMDVNSYALTVKSASQSLALVVNSAEWVGGVAAQGAADRVEQVEQPVPVNPNAEINKLARSSSPSEVAAMVVAGARAARAAREKAARVVQERLRGAGVDVEVAVGRGASLGAPAVADGVVQKQLREETGVQSESEHASAEGVTAGARGVAGGGKGAAGNRGADGAGNGGGAGNGKGSANGKGSDNGTCVKDRVDHDASAKAANADEVRYEYGDRTWRVRGLARNERTCALKVNLFVSRSAAARDGGGFHVDTVELYNARQRTAFVKQAAEELGCEERIVKRDLGRVLLALEQRQQEARKEAEEGPRTRTPKLTEAEEKAAMALLKDPNLVQRILTDMDSCGIVGERRNKLIGYLAAVSRKLDRPLAIVIQSSSAAGKSSLMDAILSLVPEEDRVQYSAMTGQSLFYMGEQDLKHRILAIVEEEGAERASYALKLLQSEGQLTIASTGKDPQSGRHVTQEYHVEGPVMIMLTTTAIDIDEELLNRCLVLTVDEGQRQTVRIHEAQRDAEGIEGLLARGANGVRRAVQHLHQNAQRLLRPVAVVNPYAKGLTFETRRTRTRRDHAKYLTLIRVITLLHQHQRPLKSVEHAGKRIEYIEVSRSDIALADKLFAEVMARTMDELPPQTRGFLEQLHEKVQEQGEALGVAVLDVRFGQRDAREWTNKGATQVKLHLSRLAELEYLAVYTGGPRRRMTYGLCDSEYDGNWSGSAGNWSGSGRGLVGGGVRPVKRKGVMPLAKLVGLNGNHVSGECNGADVVVDVAGMPSAPGLASAYYTCNDSKVAVEASPAASSKP